MNDTNAIKLRKHNEFELVVSSLFTGLLLCLPFGQADGAILLGFGQNGAGWLETVGAPGPHERQEWRQVGLAAYNAAVGETRPAACDVDGEGKDEVAIGSKTNCVVPSR